ncbi:hypothetical protein B0A49_10295 [Cryomyces minteri]|uniref:RecA family profile 1 domain-containing protein n=1 Tax=Cryomyces minteri TaxID=331657 RepID=A0A4U0WIQ5_9PEZI|nr:hypothetical protein B0A49_10295 [Cryomyces minteri]
MADLLHVLPDFDSHPYAHLLPSLEKSLVTTADVLTLDAADVARRVQKPVDEIRGLADALLREIHGQCGFIEYDVSESDNRTRDRAARGGLASRGGAVAAQWQAVSTMDATLDAALAGGIPTGYVTEITGESGAGKTQFLLSLLLSAQLPPPDGLARSSLYISTEAPLPTTRLSQMLSAHPHLCTLPANSKPSLSRILSIQTPDLESQDHILRYQVPVAVRRHNIGLVILDSVAANYRAETERPGAGNGAAAMAKRSASLIQLGALLRGLARAENVAVVVANQVADRFALVARPNPPSRPPSRNVHGGADGFRASGSARSTPPQPPPSTPTATEEPMTLDHQQRWFTGWGDDDDDDNTSPSTSRSLKTPSLGLTWTNQIAARIALIKEPEYSEGLDAGGERELVRWRRRMRVVFAAWAAPNKGAEFEIGEGGVRSVGE